MQQIFRHVALSLVAFAAMVVGSHPGIVSASIIADSPSLDVRPTEPSFVVDVWVEDVRPTRAPSVAVEVLGITIAGPEPALPPSILETTQVISYYGYPKVRGMG